MLDISSPPLWVVRPLRRRRRARGGGSGYGLRSFYPSARPVVNAPCAPFYIGKHPHLWRGATRKTGKWLPSSVQWLESLLGSRLPAYEREGRRHDPTGPGCVKKTTAAATREKNHGQETATARPSVLGNPSPALCVGIRPVAPVLRPAHRARGHQTPLDSRHTRLCAVHRRNRHIRLETRQVTRRQRTGTPSAPLRARRREP